MFCVYDETEYEKLVNWQRHVKTKGANKEKLGGGIVTCNGVLYMLMVVQYIVPEPLTCGF